MARVKYDIWMRPFLDTNRYEIRFTNEEAMNRFTAIAVKMGIYKPNHVVHHLKEWKQIPNELVDIITFGIWSYRNTRYDYINPNHWAHGITRGYNY